MAEGDTILRAARRLDAALAGERIEAEAPNPRGRVEGIARLDGLTVAAVEAIGKNLLFRFDEGVVLHSHLGMNGSWHTYAAGQRWRKPRRAAWAVLRSRVAEAVQFGGPTLRVMTEAKARLDPALARLGPDILGDGFDSGEAIARIRGAGPGIELGEAVLDQRLVAGIGNIFKSEGCWAAGIDPWRPLSDLADDELARVLAETRALMLAAVESGRMPKRVYRRPRLPCPRCRMPIRSRGQGDANRTTYWCTTCQPRSQG